MATDLSPQEKYDLITKNLQEVLNGQIIKNVLEVENRPLKIYWGTAPTGRPHCGYFVPMTKIAHFLKAGAEVTVLLADLHAFLDNMKAPLELVEFRSQYYERIVKTILSSIGVPIEKLKFTIGRSYQLNGDYTLDIFRMANVVSQNDAKRAGADVVKQVSNPLLSGLIYPIMQALDEQYLDVDAQFGGLDQRKIFVLAEEQLPTIGYKKRAHLMNPMVPGLTQGGKMSASDPNSKIDLLEEPKQVKKKIGSAFAAPGIVEGNGLISFVEYVVLPISEISTGKPLFHINRPDQYGGPLNYSTIDELKQDYESQKLSPQDLKIGVTDAINALLEPIRKAFESDAEFQELEKKAYPPPEKAKKTKKVKKIGTRYPGAKPEQSDSSAPSSSSKSEIEKVGETLKEASI